MPSQHAPDNVSFGIRTRRALMDRIDQGAHKRGVSRTRYVLDAVEAQLARDEQERE
ncbi:MAG: hypothetical protein M1499_06565 [Firmicutes bacterium]|jgi:predicted transcriptional regulator|nr:hypothetical protein [Bacillota bacterium]